MTPRKAGVQNDNKFTNPDLMDHYDEYVLESITVPTLILNAKDDPMAKYEIAVAMHSRIPDAEIKVFEDGGHPLFNHGNEVRQTITEFISRH